MDAKRAQASVREAYGEVVWFGRRGAGVKFLGSKLLRGDGGKKAVLREEHEVSRKAIAQGRPECSSCPVCSCAAFCRVHWHARPRVQQAPGLRCALSFRRGPNEDANLGRSAPREGETIFAPLRAQRSNPLSPRARKDGLLRRLC